jgi:hypothetical protein
MSESLMTGPVTRTAFAAVLVLSAGLPARAECTSDSECGSGDRCVAAVCTSTGDEAGSPISDAVERARGLKKAAHSLSIAGWTMFALGTTTGGTAAVTAGLSLPSLNSSAPTTSGFAADAVISLAYATSFFVTGGVMGIVSGLKARDGLEALGIRSDDADLRPVAWGMWLFGIVASTAAFPLLIVAGPSGGPLGISAATISSASVALSSVRCSFRLTPVCNRRG